MSKKQDQPSLNSFFKPTQSSIKRNLSEIIILSSDEDEDFTTTTTSNQASFKFNPTKKPKLEDSNTSSLYLTTIEQPTKAASKVAKYKFDPLASSSSSTTPRILTLQEINRKAQFAKRLGNLNWKESAYLEPEHYLARGGEIEGDEAGERIQDEIEEEEEEEEEGEEVSGKGKGKAIKKGKGKGKELEVTVSESRFAKFAAPGTLTSTSTSSSSSSSPSISASRSKGKGKEVVIKYTPLELQVLELKKSNPGVILMIEVGYKMRFFGDDALVASRVLNIAQFPSKHMMTASVPG